MSPDPATEPRFTRTLAGCLLLAPVLALAATALAPTLSDDASTQLRAVAAHHGNAVASAVLEIATVPLLMVAVLVLAALVASDSAVWARVGGALGILGLLDLMFLAALSAVQIEMVSGASDRSQMVALADRIEHSAIAVSGPLTIALAAGLVILAAGLRRAGRVTTAAAAAIALGGALEPVGFAAGLRPVAIASFVLLLAGFAAVARGFSAAPESQAQAAEPRPALG